MVTDSTEAGNLEIDLSVDLSSPDASSDDEVSRLADKLYEQTKVLSSDAANITLLTSSDTNVTGADLSLQHATVASDIAGIIADESGPSSQALATLQDDMHKASDAESQFVDTAHVELA